MQTFLPYSDFQESFKCLDRQRLGKQRSEVKQIYLSLTQPDYGWKHHPAVKMWKGYEKALLLYGLICCGVWRDRGYNDNLFPFFSNLISFEGLVYPPWVDDPRVHRSHRSNLIRKDPEFYGPMWPTIPDNIPYYWPTKEVDYVSK